MIIDDVLVKAPVKNKSFVETDCVKRGNALKVNHLKVAENIFSRICGNTKSKKSEEDFSYETGEAIGGTFDGECYRCGQKGHRDNNCLKRETIILGKVEIQKKTIQKN